MTMKLKIPTILCLFCIIEYLYLLLDTWPQASLFSFLFFPSSFVVLRRENNVLLILESKKTNYFFHSISSSHIDDDKKSLLFVCMKIDYNGDRCI